MPGLTEKQYKCKCHTVFAWRSRNIWEYYLYESSHMLSWMN